MTNSELLPVRHPNADFFVCDVLSAIPKDDMASMEHPFFALSTKPDMRVKSYNHAGVKIEVTPSYLGTATIHDKDLLIYSISQLMASINAGATPSRTVHLRAHDLLVATNRDTSGRGYLRLKEAFERLRGTSIITDMQVGDFFITEGFGLIDSWKIIRESKEGRMISVSVTLSELTFASIQAGEVLTLHRDYFRLRRPAKTMANRLGQSTKEMRFNINASPFPRQYKTAYQSRPPARLSGLLSWR